MSKNNIVDKEKEFDALLSRLAAHAPPKPKRTVKWWVRRMVWWWWPTVVYALGVWLAWWLMRWFFPRVYDLERFIFFAMAVGVWMHYSGSRRMSKGPGVYEEPDTDQQGERWF